MRILSRYFVRGYLTYYAAILIVAFLVGIIALERDRIRSRS